MPRPLYATLRAFFDEYQWIHITLGVIGNFTFFLGSILFFERFQAMKTVGVWLFVVGSLLMLVGAIGSALVKWIDRVSHGRAPVGASAPASR